MKLGSLLVVCVVAATTACGSTEFNAAGVAPEPATVRAESRAWDRVIIDESGQLLVVEFVGGRAGSLHEPCTVAYEAAVEPTPDQVVVTVFRLERVDPPPEGVGCDAMEYDRRIALSLRQPLGDRTVVDGHTGVAHQPTVDNPSSPMTTVTVAEQVMTTTTTASDNPSGQPIEVWLSGVRYEPWYDGFQFNGSGGILALNPEVDPPTLPAELPIQTITSRLGQRQWDQLMARLTDQLDELNVLDLRYDPFADTVTVSMSEDVGPANDDVTGDEVRSLLGDRFQDVTIQIRIGFGSGDGPPRTGFESPPTTRS
ncbi:MAG: hypothetical protein AAF531_06140 [Actinomycetota bacterium]